MKLTYRVEEIIDVYSLCGDWVDSIRRVVSGKRIRRIMYNYRRYQVRSGKIVVDLRTGKG